MVGLAVPLLVRTRERAQMSGPFNTIHQPIYFMTLAENGQKCSADILYTFSPWDVGFELFLVLTSLQKKSLYQILMQAFFDDYRSLQ